MVKILKSVAAIMVVLSFFGCAAQQAQQGKPTVCLLGGTPSSVKILDEIPEELKRKYNFISLNRPGYGGSDNAAWTKETLFKLARKAGLRKNDFAVIGVSGGGPLAILIAHEFKLKHCGVISGMVPAKDYFAYADSTFTKPLMTSVLQGYSDFEKTFYSFPNVEEIVKQADSPVQKSIRACFDDLNFILSDNNFDDEIFRETKVDWWHGEHDKNVALQSAQLFVKKFKAADLQVIPDASHGIDGRIYVKKLLDEWESPSN